MNPHVAAAPQYHWRFDHLNLHAAAEPALQRLFGEVMGLRSGYRPPFPFPGDWLYREDQAWLHLVNAASSSQGVRLGHVAFRTDEPAEHLLARVRAAGLDHEVAFVPEENCVQIFVRLPGGLVIELDAAAADGEKGRTDYRSDLALATTG